jgi:cathepsin L
MRETGNMFTGDEYQTRLGIWLTNKRLVQEHNAGQNSFQLALNRFAHLTPAEYKVLLGFKINKAERKEAEVSMRAPNAAVDWRQKGVVNPVQDQGSCGSCWSFSTCQAQESIYAINYGTLQKLSEQNLVDCVTSCNGCNGGLMTSAYAYVKSKQGGKFMLQADYPYTGTDGTCRFDSSKGVSKVTGYTEIKEGSESDLASKISAYGPACIAIDASHYSFQLYSSGVYDDSSCSIANINHAVGCVGYGVEGSKNYWIVRNSWGSSWGEKGYIRIIRNNNNKCGVATDCVIPQI